MLELGSFVVGTGGMVVQDPRNKSEDERIVIPEAKAGYWSAYLQHDNELNCALILIHDSMNLGKTLPEWQDSVGSVTLVDDAIGVFNTTKLEPHREELLPDFTRMLSDPAGFYVHKYGVMAVAGATTADCEVFTDLDKNGRAIAVKVVFWDEKENWEVDDTEEDDDDGPSEFGCFGEHDQDGDDDEDGDE